MCDSPIPAQASLFSLSRSSSARKENKDRGIFLDPQAQGNVCGQATLRPFFFVIRLSLVARDCLTVSVVYHAQSRLEIHAMKKANKQVKKVGISAVNKMSLFMLVTSHVQSFNATQQKKQLKQLDSVVLLLE